MAGTLAQPLFRIALMAAPETRLALTAAALACGALLVLPHGAALLHWALMIVAMMAPTLVTQLGHVRARSFGARQGRAAGLFVLAYCALWMLVGLAAQGLHGPWVAALLCVVAAIWQVAPWKTKALAQCHARPVLAAFGPKADADVLRFGLRHGAFCAVSCGPMMLVMAATHDLRVMVILTALILTERASHGLNPARLALPLLLLAGALALQAPPAPTATLFIPSGTIC